MLYCWKIYFLANVLNFISAASFCLFYCFKLRCLCKKIFPSFLQQRNLQRSSTRSRHVSAPVAPPPTPPHHPLPPHPQTQANQTPAERLRVFHLKGSFEGPWMFRFPPSGQNCSRATEWRRSRRTDQTRPGRPGPTQQVSKREMGLSLRSAHSSNPVLDTDKLRMDEMMEGRRLIVKSCRSLENWRCWAERGTLHLLLKKEKSDACVGGIRVLEPESVLFLEIFSLLPVLPVFMLYR